MKLLVALGAEPELAAGTGPPVHLLVNIGRLSAPFSGTPAHVFHLFNRLADTEFGDFVDAIVGHADFLEVIVGDVRRAQPLSFVI